MKEKIEALKWKWIQVRYSVFSLCIMLIAISTILFIGAYYYFEDSSIQYEMSFALFSGIIASTIVTMIINEKQENDNAKKKKAILFDAGFKLDIFSEKYMEFINNPPETFELKFNELYSICKEPAEYIVELYKLNVELFDQVEIIFIRKINSSYKFLNWLLGCELLDEEIEEYFPAGLTEESEGMVRYWKLLEDMQKNLFYLKIKWEKDGII